MIDNNNRKRGTYSGFSGMTGREIFIKLIPTLFMIGLAIYVSISKAKELGIEDASYQVRESICDAFHEEVKEYATYITYQQVALDEGNPAAAKYFEAMAASDNVQSSILYQVILSLDETYPYPESVEIGEVGTTEENLKRSYEHEYYMSREYYAEASYQAAEEQITDVYNAMVKCFKADTYQTAAYEELEAQLLNSTTSATEYFVCENCGSLTLKSPILRCANCSVFRWKIEKF